MIDVDPTEMAPLVVRATNLEVFYMEWVDVVEASGEKATWRLPSQLLARVVGALPIGSGKNVVFEQDGNILTITSGRRVARLVLISNEYYPVWAPFDPDSLNSVSGLGGRIQQVEWATSKSGEPPLTGVHINGEHLVATDRYRLAVAPCSVPISNPITVPASVFAPILKTMGDTKLAVGEGQLWLMPDEQTQIRAVIFGNEYPKVTGVMKRDHPDHVKVNRTLLVDEINAQLVMATTSRVPTLFIYFGNEEILLYVRDEVKGDLTGGLDVLGQCIHDRVMMTFTPKNLLDALVAAPNDEVTLGYNSGQGYTVMHVDGGSGYEAWVIPRKDASTAT